MTVILITILITIITVKHAKPYNDIKTNIVVQSQTKRPFLLMPAGLKNATTKCHIF